MSDGFSFPALPKPKPLADSAAQKLPPTNPLLARATVTDRTSQAAEAAAPPAAEPTSTAAAAAAAGAGAGNTTADGSSTNGDAGMGGALGKPVVLTRHQRIAPVRKKVPFEIGYSQMDWVRLTQTHPDLAGLGGQRPRRDITMEEVALHCTREDCWTVLRGKVYNITHYLKFHPGGVPLLLKVAGKDGTALFNKYHAWVNYEFMLAKCLVGLLAPPSSQAAKAAAGAGAEGTAAAAAAPAAAAPAAAAPAAVPGPALSVPGSNSSSSTDLQVAAAQGTGVAASGSEGGASEEQVAGGGDGSRLRLQDA